MKHDEDELSGALSDAGFDTPRKLPRKARTALAILGGVLLAVLLPSILIFSGRPKLSAPPLESNDWLIQANIIHRVMPRVMQSVPGQVETLVLTPQEIQTTLRFISHGESLLRLAGVPMKKSAQSEKIPFVLKYQAPHFDLTIGLNSNWRVLFGGYVVVHLRFTPSLAESKWDIQVVQASAGKLPLSSSFGRELAMSAWRSSERAAWHRLLSEVLQTVQVQKDGSLLIRYRADKLKEIIRQGGALLK